MFSAFQTFGKLGALASSVARAWSPLALWPDGIDTPGMWISPRDLTSEWQDSAGTTPVSVPGTVADSSNPVGLALDIRAGAPGTLGPELVTDGWAQGYQTPAISVSGDQVSVTYDGGTYGRATSPIACVIGRQYRVSITLVSSGVPVRRAITTLSAGVVEVAYTDSTTPGTWSAVFTATDTALWVSLGLQGASAGQTGVFEGVTCKEILGLHMLQSTSAARPLLSAYDGQTLGPGDTYDGTGYPVFQKYDGVDDGMATAAFAAGTLIDGMDCMIPVRRDSAASCVAGLYNGVAGVFFGVASADTWTCHAGVGAPTVWVDNTQLTGGTAVAADVLNAALTPGSWHILEFRNLDLSTWTVAKVGAYGFGYNFFGARGDILLYPSTDPTEDKDAARQWLADYYGVTLP